VRATLTACHLCGTERSVGIVFRARDYEYSVPGDWAVSRCADCDFYFQTPRPAPSDIPSFYPATYSAFSDDPATSWMFRLTYWLDARRIERLIGRRGRILDVGCGSGGALFALRERGPWELWGLESDDGAAAKARASGLNVHTGDLLASEFSPGTFDLIRMGHVIEHVLDPVATLQRAFALLRPGGVLFGETPDTASFDFRLFGRYWGALHVPRHLTFFNHRNLTALLRRVGFVEVRIRPRLRTVGWSAGIQNLLADRFGLEVPPAGRVRWYPVLVLLCLPLTIVQSLVHRPATMAFVARRPPADAREG
jgi:SAM-dependent methyltransferase